jgi:hypothetical protein
VRGRGRVHAPEDLHAVIVTPVVQNVLHQNRVRLRRTAPPIRDGASEIAPKCRGHGVPIGFLDV